jgi:DNA-directed RNA polymerase subunit M/transcription elongation factor TFIIS
MSAPHCQVCKAILYASAGHGQRRYAFYCDLCSGLAPVGAARMQTQERINEIERLLADEESDLARTRLAVKLQASTDLCKVCGGTGYAT